MVLGRRRATLAILGTSAARHLNAIRWSEMVKIGVGLTASDARKSEQWMVALKEQLC
jgi:hypothetical protein